MIQSPLIPKPLAYIDGRWRGADDAGRATIAVINPATGEQLADVPDLGAAETTQAIEAAARSLGQASSIAQRHDWLRAIESALLANKDELARIITLEQGKALKESIGEVEYAAGFFRVAAAELDREEAEQIPGTIRNAKWTIRHVPAGVVGLITPWNFPLAMLAKKLAPALGAGCAIVTKPAELTPLTTIALWTLLEKSGLPAGRANLVIGQAAPIGDTLCAHPLVRLISFTGSTRVGKQLMANVAPHIKRLALELGGNAPFIVFDDADLDAAADALMSNKFRCAGQTCVCANRVLVHEKVVDRFTQAVTTRVAKLKVGNGLEPGVDMGPLINRAGFDKVNRHVNDAIANGAKRAFGNEPKVPSQPWGNFFPPTVLTGVTRDMQISREETFGPVIAIQTFANDAQAIQNANGTPYGLAAYVFTHDSDRARQISEQLQFGHVGVNTGTGPTPEAPFGGMKQSGFGREGGAEGLLEFCETQVVATAT